MIREVGLYRGSTKFIKLEIFDRDGNMVTIDPANLVLNVYKPDGSLFASYNSGFDPQPDGSVFFALTIPDTAPTGIWRVVWEYIDEYGNKWVEEMPFVVSEART